MTTPDITTKTMKPLRLFSERPDPDAPLCNPVVHVKPLRLFGGAIIPYTCKAQHGRVVCFPSPTGARTLGRLATEQEIQQQLERNMLARQCSSTTKQEGR